MNGPKRRFDPSELRSPEISEPSTAELADALGAARDLEALAASDTVGPTTGFDDRVMAAIALEPIPRAVASGGSTARGTGPTAFLFALRNAWRVGTTGGRPFAVRAQALAFVLIVAVAVGSLAGAGAIAVGGLLRGNDAIAPPVVPSQTTSPTTDTQATPSPAPSATPSAIPSPTPTETAEPTDTPGPGETARPTRTPRATRTPEPGETPKPTEDNSGPGGGGGGSGGNSGPGGGGGGGGGSDDSGSGSGGHGPS